MAYYRWILRRKFPTNRFRRKSPMGHFRRTWWSQISHGPFLTNYIVRNFFKKKIIFCSFFIINNLEIILCIYIIYHEYFN